MAQIVIEYGTERHGKMVRAVLDRVQLSYKKLSERYDEWDRIEKEMVSYIPAADAERKAKTRREESSYTQIKIPYSYGMMLTSHTYYSSVFLGRSPIHQVQGLHGEGQNQTLAHEAIMNYQVSRGGHVPHYMVWLLDVAKYGVGFLGTYWDKQEAQVSQLEEVPVENEGIGGTGRTRTKRTVKRVTSFEGNVVYNVRPFDMIVDPRVPLMNMQDGEFAGRKTNVSFNHILKGEAQGKYFNIKALLKNNSSGSKNADTSGYGIDGDNPALVEKAQRENLVLNIHKDKDYVKLVELYIEISPKDWGLGESNYPETWVFTVANDEILIGLQPLGLFHNKFPFGVLEREVDGHGLTSRGLPQIAQPLQNSMDWLANSHFYNVQKGLNNEYVVDPSMVNIRDFKDPRPGKLIKLRPAAYGKDARTAIHQLTQVDFTRTHLQDMRVIEGLFQKVFGINDQLMGALNTTGRKTATEVRTSSSFGINRLKTDAEFFSATGWRQLSTMFVQNNQQLYTAEQKFRIAGNNIQSGEFVNVSPETLAGMYDIVTVDGSLPIDRFAQAGLWKEIIANAARLPPSIQGSYDWAAIFGWMAKLAGLKNIDSFKVQGGVPNVTMENPQALQAEAKKGNIVPTTEV
jgi:hypothetical protein